MSPDLWVIGSASLVGASGGALVAWVLAREAHRREIAEQKAQAASEIAQRAASEVEQMKREIANMGRVAQSKLYRDSFEDVAFGAMQAALRIAVAEEELKIARQCLELGAKK